MVICEPGPKPPIVPEPRPPDPGPDLPSIVTPAPRPVVPVLDSSTILPYVVKVAVELPLSREEFNREKQEVFVAPVSLGPTGCRSARTKRGEAGHFVQR